MPYYMGDYYYGSRRGDPGFLSFLGGLAKTAVGFIPGVGPALSQGLGAIMDRPKAAPSAAGAALTPPGFYSGASAKISRAKSSIVGAVKAHPVLTAAGAAGLGAVAGAGGAIAAKHLLGGGGRRRRRMRVTNPKALRRAIRRTQGFAKLAMKTIHITHPKKRCSFGGFKKRRKR
jgi:hypothetical protein